MHRSVQCAEAGFQPGKPRLDYGKSRLDGIQPCMHAALLRLHVPNQTSKQFEGHRLFAHTTSVSARASTDQPSEAAQPKRGVPQL